jgi:ABC-type arginine transport system permease subunit
MSTSIQTLYAVVVTVGIAVVVSIAFIALGSFGARGKANAQKVVRAVAAPAQHPTQTDEVRELVLQ